MLQFLTSPDPPAICSEDNVQYGSDDKVLRWELHGYEGSKKLGG